MRFYGGGPAEWLGVPWGVARACLEAIPRLQAREALVASTVVAVGTGSMRRQDLERTRREWARQAGHPRGSRPAGEAQLAHVLAGMGVGFQVRGRGGD